MIILSGCKAVEQFSPDQVMENVITSDTEDTPYYGEMTITMTDPDESFEMYVKEWRKGRKSLEEVTTDGSAMITLKEGKKITMYDVEENTLFETEFEELSELNHSSKERIENLLELTEDTHTLKKQGDDEIAGREAIHLVAEKKPDEKSLYGKQEIWIDKENWLVLKTINYTGDSYTKMEYTKLEFDPNMDDSVFTIDIPDDVTIETFEEEDLSETITLDEAIERLEHPFMYFPDTDTLTLEEVVYFDSTDEFVMKSVDLKYHLEGLPYMELSIVSSEESSDDEDVEMTDEMSDPVTIRGNEGSYLDLDGAHILTWEEGEYDYTIWFINPNTIREEVGDLVKTMEEIPTNEKGVEHDAR